MCKKFQFSSKDSADTTFVTYFLSCKRIKVLSISLVVLQRMQQQQQQTQAVHMKMKVEATADTDVTIKQVQMDVEPQVRSHYNTRKLSKLF